MLTRPALGWRPPPTPHRGRRLALADVHRAVLAQRTRVDLEGFCPPIQHQGSYSSCVGHAVARALAIRLRFQLEGRWLPSPLQLWRYGREALGVVAEDEGTIAGDVLAAAHTRGFGADEYFPYATSGGAFAQPLPRELVVDSEQHRLITSEPLDYDVDTWRWELACGHPLVIGVRVFDGLYTPSRDGTIALPSGPERGGHSMCVVGYDDDRQALRLHNSWGTSWGDLGRGWIPYRYLLNPLWCGEIHSVRVVRSHR